MHLLTTSERFSVPVITPAEIAPWYAEIKRKSNEIMSQVASTNGAVSDESIDEWISWVYSSFRSHGGDMGHAGEAYVQAHAELSKLHVTLTALSEDVLVYLNAYLYIKTGDDQWELAVHLGGVQLTDDNAGNNIKYNATVRSPDVGGHYLLCVYKEDVDENTRDLLRRYLTDVVSTTTVAPSKKNTH